jgi:elongation factor P
MLSYFDLRKGTKFIFRGEPYEVLEFKQVTKAQDVAVAKTKIKNLITGKVLEVNFHQSDTFEEAEIEKVQIKFIYSHRDKYFFSLVDDPSKRFELKKEQIGDQAEFLKPNLILEGLKFEGRIINVKLPIKVNLKVIETPPALRGERAQSGTKQAILETGTKINVPPFIQPGDIIEVNTETGEYVKRVE